MVGGAPMSQEFADDFGADGYGKDAIDCVDIAKRFLGLGEPEEEPVPVSGS
jgi:5-methyltetrahydrofolate--homocysteine methyltransferase